MNEALAARARRSSCTLCKMANGAAVVCETASGPGKPDVLVVTKHHMSQSYLTELNYHLEQAGINVRRVSYTAAVKCRNYDMDPGRVEVKACARYLKREIELLKPKVVLALGNEALQASLGRSGVTKYRGQAYPFAGSQVVPTVSLGAVQRNPRELQAFIADIAYVGRMITGQPPSIPSPMMLVADDKPKLKRMLELVESADSIAYDVETTMGSEFAEGAAIISLAIAVAHGERVMVCVVPLFHPQSVWRSCWQRVVALFHRAFRKVKHQIAHNGKFDQRWLWQYGAKAKLTFDTMLAVHTIDENQLKNLKTVARTLLGVAPWGVDTKNLLIMPIRDVLRYNAKDAYYTWHLWPILKAKLMEDNRLWTLFHRMTVPASNVYTASERRGIWVDEEERAEQERRYQLELISIEEKLAGFLPDLTYDNPAEFGWPTTGKRGRLADVNYNPSIFSRWFLFEHLGLPVLDRGKEKPNGDPGDPSMREALMLELRDEHPAVQLMLDRATLVKNLQFLTSYHQHMDERGRLHTTFKLYGTNTGRTSSGKAGDDKLVGRAATVERGVNIQQVPRESRVRGVFGSPPGWTFVQADQSQVELRIIAYLSRDPVMLMLYQQGQDIHRATASSVLGIAPSQVTTKDRKSAKAVNFGFMYGMSWAKFIHTAFEKYDLRFTEDEARAIRVAYFAQFPGLLPWHEKQRRLARQYKRIQSPLGRIRHLPDVDSREREVAAEAQRQAINAPVQSFASDLVLMAMVTINRELRRRRLPAYIVGTVHDAINLEVRDDALAEVLPIVKTHMESPPLWDWFGVELDVPLVADISLGRHWGGAKELTTDQVMDWQGWEAFAA